MTCICLMNGVIIGSVNDLVTNRCQKYCWYSEILLLDLPQRNTMQKIISRDFIWQCCQRNKCRRFWWELNVPKFITSVGDDFIYFGSRRARWIPMLLQGKLISFELSEGELNYFFLVQADMTFMYFASKRYDLIYVSWGKIILFILVQVYMT